MEFEKLLKENGVEDPSVILNAMKENGIYLSKEENMDIRYSKLKEQNASLTSERDTANSTIEELKKNAEDAAKLKSTIAEYEQKLKDAEEEKRQAEQMQKINSALLKAGGEDIDYLNYKLMHKDDFNMDNLEKEIAELKDNYPKQFKDSEEKNFHANKLKESDKTKEETKKDFTRMSYKELSSLKAENPEAYEELKKE